MKLGIFPGAARLGVKAPGLIVFQTFVHAIGMIRAYGEWWNPVPEGTGAIRDLH